jgi:hypothetical protein
MTSSRWNDAMLDVMRLVGDPPADAAIEAIFASGQENAAQAFMTRRMTNAAPAPSSLPSALRVFLEETLAEPSGSVAYRGGAEPFRRPWS